MIEGVVIKALAEISGGRFEGPVGSNIGQGPTGGGSFRGGMGGPW